MPAQKLVNLRARRARQFGINAVEVVTARCRVVDFVLEFSLSSGQGVNEMLNFCDMHRLVVGVRRGHMEKEVCHHRTT